MGTTRHEQLGAHQHHYACVTQLGIADVSDCLRDAYPLAPNQQVQEMFDIDEPNAPDNWRQARIDLADYAGQSN